MSILVATYVRQSIEHQEGLDRQTARLRADAARRGWTIVTEYSDNDVSASKARGPKTQWARMLKDAEAGHFTHVLAVDLDRLIRGTRDLLTLIDLGLLVVTVDGEIDLSTADGEFRATMLAGIARFETRRKSERQVRANAARSASGRPVPGRRRYGYDSDNITPRETEAAHVRWAFNEIAEGRSLRGIATALDMRTVRVRDMLQNPSYKGKVRHLGTVQDSVIVPLVTEELWEAVNAILSDPARKTSPGSAIKYVASGIAECGVCGAPMHHQNEYICSASTAHVFIGKRFLDPRIEAEVFHWLVEHPEAEPSGAASPRLSALLAESAEVQRQRAALTELAMMPGVDLADLRKRFVKIATDAERIAGQITAERGAQSRSGLVEQVRGEWFARGDNAYTEQEDAALEAWPAYWQSLGLERQRAVVRSLFKITVNKGRDNHERVKFAPV